MAQVSYLGDIAYPDAALVLRQHGTSAGAIGAALERASMHFPPYPWNEAVRTILLKEIEQAAPAAASRRSPNAA